MSFSEKISAIIMNYLNDESNKVGMYIVQCRLKQILALIVDFFLIIFYFKIII